MVLFLWLECWLEQTEIKSADPDGRLAKLFDGLLRFETVDAAGYADGSFLWFGRLFGRTEIKSAGPDGRALVMKRHRLMLMVLTIPKLKYPARSCASLTAGPVCLHLPAYADFESQKAPTNCRRFSFEYRCAFSEPAVPR